MKLRKTYQIQNDIQIVKLFINDKKHKLNNKKHKFNNKKINLIIYWQIKCIIF